MTSFQEAKILPYEPEELFNLVWDINSYPKFLPWCLASRIISENNEELIAELAIGLKGFSESYCSRVTSQKTNRGIYIIDTIAISGPFKYLKSTWQFLPHSLGTEIKFFIDFEMKSVILERLIGNHFFVKATKKMITAFEKRAEEIIKKI